MSQRPLNPISPAKAGVQIHPEQLGVTRRTESPGAPPFLDATWIPAFAGTFGFKF